MSRLLLYGVLSKQMVENLVILLYGTLSSWEEKPITSRPNCNLENKEGNTREKKFREIQAPSDPASKYISLDEQGTR